MSKNIVLIGMPGAGKTTIGKMLHERLKRKFVDMDEFIVEESGKTIPELFALSECNFRDVESMAVRKLSMENSAIIATGGGVVKRKENIDELKKQGIIVFIDRPLANIEGDVEISTRPLLNDGIQQLYDLYDERYEIYKNCCDFHVMNDREIEDVVDTIIEKCT
ncbi:MAG: shikimate kinase [Firmicutes bacterium]|nr:shikimate kinase [Bacillota bacterium]